MSRVVPSPPPTQLPALVPLPLVHPDPQKEYFGEGREGEKRNSRD